MLESHSADPTDSTSLVELVGLYRGRFALDFAYDDWANDYRDNLHAAVWPPPSLAWIASWPLAITRGRYKSVTGSLSSPPMPMQSNSAWSMHTSLAGARQPRPSNTPTTQPFNETNSV